MAPSEGGEAAAVRRQPSAELNRILVAVDDSVRALDVLAVAAGLARRTGAALRLFEAVSLPPEFPPSAHVDAPDPLPAFASREATRRLDTLKAAAGADLRCDYRVELSRSPWRAILAAADQYDADLIVVGSHGYSVLDRALGTTAAKVSNHSSRNVLVVHRRWRPLARLDR
jgi:universal stress protein F